MKTKLTLVLLLSLTFCALAQSNDTVSLAWNYPANEITNRAFAVFTSPNLAPPYTNWTFVTNFSATNYTAIVTTNAAYNVRVPRDYGPQFWTVATTDAFDGLVFFDIAAWTNARPRLNQPIVIER